MCVCVLVQVFWQIRLATLCFCFMTHLTMSHLTMSHLIMSYVVHVICCSCSLARGDIK